MHVTTHLRVINLLGKIYVTTYIYRYKLSHKSSFLNTQYDILGIIQRKSREYATRYSTKCKIVNLFLVATYLR